MLYDVLQESKAYQKIKQEGELDALRQAILAIVQIRFPKIVQLTKKQVDAVNSPAVLQKLVTNFVTVQTAEEARQHLLALDDEEEGS